MSPIPIQVAPSAIQGQGVFVNRSETPNPAPGAAMRVNGNGAARAARDIAASDELTIPDGEVDGAGSETTLGGKPLLG